MAPPMVVALAKHPVVDNYDLSSLRWILSGAAPLSAAPRGRVRPAGSGAMLCRDTGMTELSPVSHATPAGMFRPGLVGAMC